MKSLLYLNKYLYRYRVRILLGTAFVGLSVFFSILIPPAIRDALDFIMESTKSFTGNEESATFKELLGEDILLFSGKIIGFSLLSGLFMYLMRKTLIVMSRLVEYDLRKDIYEHYQSLDLGFYKRNKTGDLMARVSSDVSKVRMYLGPAIMYGIRVSFLFSFIIYSMFQVNTTLSLYALLPLPFLSISIYYISSIINKKSADIQEQIAQLNTTAQEVYSGIRIVKSYAKEKEFRSHFEDESADYRRKALRLARVQALFFPMMILLVSISTLLTIYIGGKLVVAGEITTGNIAEFVIYINLLTWPITSIGWIASLVQTAAASQSRINQIMETESDIPLTKSNQSESTPLLGTIEFKNVSFTYPDTGITALENVSFKTEPGEKLLIVGKTASGKSTIAELILRFYDVTSGEILLDGKNVKEHNVQNIRRRIGYVPQNVFLFSDTVESNIKMGKPEALLPQVKTFAGIAAVDSDILEFPDAYGTKIGERGVTLSGGQKQRLSIARALIKSPDIVLLDDCLSAVDANTEHQILSHIDQALGDKTALVITHRVSNILDFDKVLVLEKGRIQDIGTHSEVLKANSYYQLLNNQ